MRKIQSNPLISQAGEIEVQVNDEVGSSILPNGSMRSSKVKICVEAPESHADKVREAMGKAGAGVIGKYADCSFSVKGIGRFTPQAGAQPAIGTVGKAEAVNEEQIQMLCGRSNLAAVIAALKKVHPYEEPGIAIYSLEELP